MRRADGLKSFAVRRFAPGVLRTRTESATGRKIALLLCLVLWLLVALMPSSNARQERVVRPPLAPGPLDNPLKGWCTYTYRPLTQPYSMVFRYVAWKDLEPREGEYHFAAWEKRDWDEPAARGKYVVFRIYVDYPGQPSGMPGWLLATGVKTTPYKEYGGGLSPDYDDPRMIAALERLVAALGRRYDRNPRVAFVEMGFLGFWGEWHTYPRTELFASPSTQRRILAAAHRALPHKVLMVRYPGVYASPPRWLGYFDDAFPEDTGGPEDWKFLSRMRRAGRMDAWQSAAIGGEMVPHTAPKWLGDSFAETLREIEATHFSWVGPYNPALEAAASPEYIARCQQMVRCMGYQFALTEIRHAAAVPSGGRLWIHITGENQGVAPFYYPWPVDLALLDAQQRVVEVLPVRADIRTWLPGPFRIAADPVVHARPGRYTLALGIRDPWSDRPAIAFANALPRHAGWTLLSTVRVTARRRNPRPLLLQSPL